MGLPIDQGAEAMATTDEPTEPTFITDDRPMDVPDRITFRREDVETTAANPEKNETPKKAL